MKRFLLASFATFALLVGGLFTPADADAQSWRYRGGYTYRPYYGSYYRPYGYYQPYYYSGPRYYSGYYGSPQYGYPRYYSPAYYGAPAYYYGSPYARSAGVYLGAPGVGVYVR
jgi:hypothetical protein